MTIPRFYLPIELAAGNKILLPAEASHHLLKVLRVNLEEKIAVFNGWGGEFQAKLLAVKKGLAEILLENFIAKNTESPLQIHLGQVIARGEKMDYIIQKATELGVSKITPLFSERCNVTLSEERLDKRLQHWQGVAVSAAEQSGRVMVPVIAAPVKLITWVEDVAADLKLTLDVSGTWQPHSVPAEKNPTNLAFLVGPEGGLSEAELALAAKYDFKAWRLGPRILRTETAALVAISVLQEKFGDLSAQ